MVVVFSLGEGSVEIKERDAEKRTKREKERKKYIEREKERKRGRHREKDPEVELRFQIRHRAFFISPLKMNNNCNMSTFQ